MLAAVNLPPSPTLVNQALAMGGWGVWLALTSRSAAAAPQIGRGPIAPPLGLALGAFGIACIASPSCSYLPWGIGLTVLGVVCAAAAVAWSGWSLDSRHSDYQTAFGAFAAGLLITGSLSAAIGCVQVFAPDLPDGDWVARSVMPGRAVGNVRQPNHLSSLLLWTLIILVALRERSSLRAPAVCALAILQLFALVLTGSRTGILGVGALALWGFLDRRLSRWTRWALLVSPLLFAAMWFGTAAWSHATAHTFGAEGRFAFGSGDISSSRFAIWSNALSMIGNEPWTGVGFGEFNLAWTLSAFPDRPRAFFDHTHNLPLQLIVELGVPLGSLVFVLLLVAMAQARQRAWACEGDEGVAKRAAFMIVLMVGLHSMLEYPLWYAYFLLPTAFAWGFALAKPTVSVDRAAISGDATPSASRALALAGLAMTIGATAAMLDYRSVVVIYDPPEDPAPLEERIVRGQRSLLFGQHADYAAATAFGEPKAPLSPSQELAFKRAPHQLLDIRLMIAWSQALAAQGELDKARWLAARIREFRNPGADEYLAPCQRPEEAARAFQCQPPTRVVHWREFVRR
jgi:hypothetical protein